MIKSKFNSNPNNKKRFLLTALIIVVIILFVTLTNYDKMSNSHGDNNSKLVFKKDVLGSSLGFCDVLGLETGVVESKPRDFEKYYDVNPSVISTVVCRGEEGRAIAEVKNSPAIKNHVVRLIGRSDSDCFFDANQASSFIARLRKETADLPFDVFVLPANEPRTDLAPFLGEDPIAHSNWLSSIMANLKSNRDNIISNTKDYMLFPAFNYHNPDGSNSNDYISRFIINYNGDINNDFYAMSVSVQKENGYSPMLDRMKRFSQLLVDLQVSNSKLALFSANVVNAEANDDYIKELQDIFREYRENLIGIYIFSPWGWDYSQSGLVRNLAIPDDIWKKLFENCSLISRDNEYSCDENFVDTLPALKSCQTIGPKNHLFGGVRVAKNSEGKRVALPIITVQTEMTFLNWLTDSNYLNKLIDKDFEGPPVGTFANRIKAPCAVDRFLVQNPKFDMTKVFSGTIKLKTSKKYEFDYKMPGLGNALACMIWNPNDFSSSSYPLSQLENRFYSEGFINYEPLNYNKGSKELLKTNFEDIRDWLLALSSRFSENRTYCSGWVSRVEESDSIKGPEMIALDGEIDFSDDDTICRAIKSGNIDIGWVRFDQVCGLQSNGKYKYIDGLANPYYKVDYGSVDEIEILGGNKALASMWLEEAQNNPWGGMYDIIHRDKAGVKVTVKQSLYDGLSNTHSYKSPLSTNGQCSLFEYDGDKALSPSSNYAGVPGSVQKETEYIVPWLGQILNIQKRESLIFASYKDAKITNSNMSLEDGYIEKRSKIIKDFIQEEDDELDLEKLGKILYQILYPTNIFKCDDLDGLVYYLEEEKSKITNNSLKEQVDMAIRIINQTDCLAPKDKEPDPLNQWLCDQNLIDQKYCKFECVAVDHIFSSTSCIIKSDIRCYQATRGTLSHWQYTDDLPLDLYSAKVGNSRNFSVIAPDDMRILAYTPSYFYGENLCGAKIVTESLTVPGLIFHLNHFDPSTIRKTAIGDIYQKGEYIGELIQLHNNCVAGAHLHFYAKYYENERNDVEAENWLHDNVSNFQNVNPYSLLELWGCGQVTCTPYSTDAEEVKSAITANDLYTILPASKDNINNNLQDNRMEDSQITRTANQMSCITLGGQNGYLLGKSLIPKIFDYDTYFESRFLYADEDVKALHDRIVNMCGVNIPDCDTQCKENIKQAILRVADFNNTDGYSNDEISYFIDRMYEETRGMTQMNFQTLVAMWLAENGLNPRHKNDAHPSDIFGCGVYCDEDKPQNFDEELACTLGKPYPNNSNPQCGVFYPFEPETPGNYLEVFGPITDGNGSYAEKVILVLERLLLLEGVSMEDLRTGDINSCYLYPRDYDESLIANSSWVGPILDQIYTIRNLEEFYTRGE